MSAVARHHVFGGHDQRAFMDAVVEIGEVCDGRSDKTLRLLLRVGDGPGLMHQIENAGEVLRRQRPGLHPVLDHLTVCLRAVAQQVEQGEGRPSLPQILADGFTQTIAVGGVVQGIVRELERHPEMLAEAEERLLLPVARAGDNGADLAGGRDQSGSLVLDDREVVGHRHRGVAVVIQLEDFAFGHFPAGVRQHFIDGMGAELHHLPHGFGIEIVAHQNADLIAPHLPGALASPADIGIVDHIVMQEGRGMDVFHQAAELPVVGAGVAAESRREHQEQRPNALAAAAENVAGD